MKKMKLIAPIISIGAISGIVLPLIGCSCTTETKVTDVILKGTHNVDINDANTWTFVAQDQNNNNITNDCDFKSSDDSIATFKSGSTLTLQSALTTGGSITITATHKATGKSNTFEVEFATFNKLNTDSKSDYCLQKGFATKKRYSS